MSSRTEMARRRSSSSRRSKPMKVEQGLKRLTWVVSSLGLLVLVLGLGAAGYNYFVNQRRVMRPFTEQIDKWEELVVQKRASIGDAEKGRAYIAFMFVRETLGKNDASVPSGNQDDSKWQATRYVRGYLEDQYPVLVPLGPALGGLAWFAGVWIIFAIIRWIVRGFTRA